LASNDPTDTGGLFIGRRPGTAPARYRAVEPSSERRRRVDALLAHGLLAIELVLCLSLLGPQPLGWLWVGSQVDYRTDSVFLGITIAFAGLLASVIVTLVVATRLDHVWRLLRRAAGHDQREGALGRIFMAAAIVAAIAFTVWLVLIEGPAPSVAPR
jgi:hypothetical protein